MNKFLSIIVLAAGFTTAISAQKKADLKSLGHTVPKKNTEPVTQGTNTFSSNTNSKKTTSYYQRFSGSHNVYGMLVSQSNVLQHNKELNLTSFVGRKSALWTGIPNGNVGTVACTWTTDNGTTWDSTIMFAHATVESRYPSGGIYNPAANTDPANAYAVGSGPYHKGDGWLGNYFASKPLGSTNKTGVTDTVIIAKATTPHKQDFARVDFQITDDGIAHVIGGINKDVNETATTWFEQGFRGAAFSKGVFSAGKFTWTTDSILPNFKVRPGPSQPTPTGSLNFYRPFINTNEYHMAWSQDGQIGYVVFFGIDANAQPGTSQNSYQPLVWKSTDAGATWNRIHALYDFNQIPAIADRIFPLNTNPSLKKPFFADNNGSDVTVDVNGNLHIVCVINSAFSDHLDTLSSPIAYDFPNKMVPYIFDVHTTSTGWDAFVVDSIMTEAPGGTSGDPGYAENQWIASQTIGSKIDQDARIQISRTADGKYIFYGWMDTDTEFGTFFNVYPNIKVKGFDVLNNKTTKTKNITAGKAGVENNIFFYYLSATAVEPSANNFLIPAMYSDSKLTPKDGDSPVDHYYVNDITFSQSEFEFNPLEVGVEELLVNGSNVSQNYPNPAETTTKIDVNLKEANKLDISICNSIGQVVYTKSINGQKGVNTFDVNVKHLTSGLYFYSVSTNGTSVTKKMIVK